VDGMIDVNSFVKRAAEKSNFNRVRFQEANMPTTISNITAMPFFGDIRSIFILSSMLLHRYKEEKKGSKYFILCSWPGFEDLFPYVDEYWSIEGGNDLSFYGSTLDFSNTNKLAVMHHRNLNMYFEDVVDHKEFDPFYVSGLKPEFFDTFKNFKRFLPLVPSAGMLSAAFNKEMVSRSGFKVFIYPSVYIKKWKGGRSVSHKTKKLFWVSFIKKLIDAGYVPVIYNSVWTHNVSDEFTNECIFVKDEGVGKMMSCMRAVGCVVDLFSDISMMAIAARTPYLAVDERMRCNNCNTKEIEALCANSLPKQHIYTFATIIDSDVKDIQDKSIFDLVIARLDSFLPSLNRDSWPSTAELMEIVPYKAVKAKKAKRIGTRFIKVPKDL
jgi:hypothetical protein